MRYMIVHTEAAVLHLDGSTNAHAFGPFDSWSEANAWDQEHPDACYRVALPIVGPGPIDQLLYADASEQFAAQHVH